MATTPAARPPLFTPVFFIMCGFSFTVFLSAFLLLPTAPKRILALGGSSVAAGSFLGLLTFASAFTAPLTGAVADRFGRRRTLFVCGLVLALFAVGYGAATAPAAMLWLVLAQGVFWSGLLSASAAYITGVIPESRRAEGIGYWGLSTMLAIAVAPSIGLWLYARGWERLCTAAAALNLVMAAIALTLTEQPRASSAAPFLSRHLLEWRVLLVSLTLFLYSFGYGAVTSFVAIHAGRERVPPGLYFTVLAVVIILARPFVVPLADRFGHRWVLVPAFVLIPAGLALLALADRPALFVASAVVFALGFGSAYPVFAAHVTRGVEPARRGAAFGAILAAFDTGIGTGSIGSGWIIGRWGFPAAYGAAAVLASLSLPYFLYVERKLLSRRTSGP
jgi:MFS family permease